jgi:phosphate-selective porin OprO/OprP
MFNGTPANSDRNDGETFLFAWRVAVVPWQGTIGGKDGKWSVAADGYSDRAANLTDMPAEFGFNSSGGGAPDKVFQGDRMAWGVDSQVRAGDIEVWAEYLRDRFEPTNNLPADRLDADGYYVLALANLTVMERKYQILARYDRFDPDRVIKGDETRTWTVGVNWFLKGWDLVWELNYLLVTAPGTEARGSDDKIISRLQFVF